MNEIYVDIGLYLAYFMVVIALIGAVVLPLINASSQPKLLVKPVAALLGLIVLFIIGYAFAGDFVGAKAQAEGVTGGISKMVGGGLICMYILFAAALVGIVFTEINKVLK